MTAEHNHEPWCCCTPTDAHTSLRCPACPEHGELAPAIECPQCHQPIGRPHTETCTLAPDRVWPTWQVASTNATGEHNQPHPNNPCPTEWTASRDEPWHRCTLPASHHPAISHLCWCGDLCELVIGGTILDEAPSPPAGHHLVHSEAFIDQDDPRGPKP